MEKVVYYERGRSFIIFRIFEHPIYAIKYELTTSKLILLHLTNTSINGIVNFNKM